MGGPRWTPEEGGEVHGESASIRRLGMSLTSGSREIVPGRLLTPGERGWIFFSVQGIEWYHLHFYTVWLFGDGVRRGQDGRPGDQEGGFMEVAVRGGGALWEGFSDTFPT